MKFSIKINRWANFYFFIQNLSEWHFSCRKEYNDFWIKTGGNLSDNEVELLQKIKDIRKQFRVSKSLFEDSFFLCDDVWLNLEKTIDKDKLMEIKEIFKSFEKKFNLIYKNNISNLEKWAIKLTELNNNKRSDKVIKILNSLLNTKVSNQEVQIFLLLSSPDKIGGGSNIGSNSISLEISQLPINPASLQRVLGVIWHETVHLYFQSSYLFPLLLKNSVKPDFFNELIVNLLFPRGILGSMFLNLPSAKKILNLSEIQTQNLFALTKSYMDLNKMIDVAYINNINKILKGA